MGGGWLDQLELRLTQLPTKLKLKLKLKLSLAILTIFCNKHWMWILLDNSMTLPIRELLALGYEDFLRETIRKLCHYWKFVQKK